MEEDDADLPSLKVVHSPPAEAGGGRAGPRLYGRARSHPLASDVAAHVHDMLFRYAREVVSAFGLCPFLHNVDTGMGRVGVIFDAVPDVDTALAAIRDLAEPVVHLAFPLVTGPASKFEPFGSRLAEAVRRALPDPLVHATFHPALTGGRENAHRLVGLLRQAPDPFIQFIPPGLAQGGTVLAGEEVREHSHAEARFTRLMSGPIDDVLARVEALKAERAIRYAAMVEEMSRTP